MGDSTGAARAWVCGGGSCEVCGNGRDSTCPTGAPCEIEPVASPWAPRAVGPSPKRVSPLQPASPIVTSASAIARSGEDGRTPPTKEFMFCSLERNNNTVS
jgi:hypothetical protein